VSEWFSFHALRLTFHDRRVGVVTAGYMLR